MKRSTLATSVLLGALGLALGAAGPTQRVVDAPHRRPPGIRRYKAIERVDRTKQHDQQAKLERRAAIAEKMAYNAQRADHKLSARAEEHGKRY